MFTASQDNSGDQQLHQLRPTLLGKLRHGLGSYKQGLTVQESSDNIKFNALFYNHLQDTYSLQMLCQHQE